MTKGRKPRRNGQAEQTEILRAIWNEMKALNGRIDTTNGRLDQTNERLDQTNERLDQTNEQLGALRGEVRKSTERIDTLQRFVVEKDVRLSTEIMELSGHVTALVTHLRKPPDRAELDDLRQRVARLEAHTGLSKGN